MKINPNINISRKEITKTDQTISHQVGQKNFSDTLNQQEDRASQEQLKRIIQQIQSQGDRLARSMTLRELRGYKLLVRRFLEEAVRGGVSIKETRGWDRRGRGKRYKLLEEIDRQLLDMADELLMSEQGKIELLNGIGEIRGMLVNLLY